MGSGEKGQDGYEWRVASGEERVASGEERGVYVEQSYSTGLARGKYTAMLRIVF